jgi:arylsulfatase A-like enzyme
VNYLLFYPDEMRAESLACYGHPVVQTPNFDRVAAEGTVFENAYSAHPVCAPSRASLVTGWFPHVQGHRTLRYLLDDTTPNCRAMRTASRSTAGAY